MSHSAPCLVCGTNSPAPLLTLPAVPVYCNVLYDTRDEARAAARGDLALHGCLECGHVWNAAFDPSRVEYDASYENSLHFSPRFQQYADELARDLVARHALQGKHVVETACGQGDFLEALCALADARGTGFDPAYVPERGAKASGRVTYVTDYFGPDNAPADAALLACRQALEHFPEPASFLRDLREALGDSRPVVFFEVPNSLWSLRDLGIWDFIYEHVSYFWRGSLTRAFEQAGFAVAAVQETFGGQFLTLEAVPVTGETEATRAGLDEVLRYLSELPAAFARVVDEWRVRLAELAARGERVAVWGAGSKGVTFTNLMQQPDAVACLVDVNPAKRGQHIPGTGHQVVAPEDLAAHEPVQILVMNPLYQNEIGRMAAAHGVGCPLVGI